MGLIRHFSGRNHFIFTPLLASTTVGTLEHRCIIESVRAAHRHVDYHQAWCTAIDFASRRLHLNQVIDDASQETGVAAVGLRGGRRDGDNSPPHLSYSLPFDHLVIASGASINTFGIEGVQQYAHFLKEVSDARRIRSRIIDLFEAADSEWHGASLDRIQCQEASPPSPFLPSSGTRHGAIPNARLHFVIVGGGPTGVEFAAELHDFIRDDLAHLFPHLKEDVRISLFDVAPRLLGGFDARLAAYTRERFGREGIAVHTGTAVTAVGPDYICIRSGDDKANTITRLPVGMVVWATGLAPNSLARSLSDVALQTYGRLRTDQCLRLLNREGGVMPDVYAIGDCSIIQDDPLPCTAQVAKQQAQYLARILQGRLGSASSTDTVLGPGAANWNPSSGPAPWGPPIPPFRYRPMGMMAYVGGWRAIADIRRHEVSGRVAWLVWRSVYFSMAVSLKNKILIPIYWFLTWIFGRDIAKL